MDLLAPFLQIALHHSAKGFHVHPLWTAKKKPLTDHGWHDATTDAEQVREWWIKWPDANVGIACGPSNLCVLDIDHGLTDENGFQAWREAVGLPETYAVRTGRRPEFGVQMYYSGAIPEVGLWKLNGCEGQIKSLGGYVLAAGSLHPSGETYQVICEAPIARTPDIVRQLRAEKAASGKDAGPITVNRNIELTSIAGKLRNAGLSQEAMEVALLQVNDDRCVPPLDDDEVKHVAASVARYDVPEPVGVVVIGKTTPTPKPAPLPQSNRPVYPIEVWDGTAAGEFSKLCAHDNNIPRKFYVEAFLCCLGAVVGDRITCPVDGALPRSYTVIIAPKGKGKGSSIRRAVNFFSQTWDGTRATAAHGIVVSNTPALLQGVQDFIWKPQGIGARNASASSAPGMIRLTQELKKTQETSPNLCWGSTLPRILSVHEEFKTFLSTLFIEGGTGMGMDGVICQLWDDVNFSAPGTDKRTAVYGQMMFSLLAGVTEEDWFDLLSRGNAVGGGLMSRFNLIGTEGGFQNVSRMTPPDLTNLQETFLPRVRLLADAGCRVHYTEGADRVISEWAATLPEGSERMNIHAWRNALRLAWLRREDAISERTASDAALLGQYQVASHEYYRTKKLDTPNARVQEKILRALKMKGPLPKRDLQRLTNAHRDGTELWNRALAGLVQDGRVGQRDDGAYYMAEE